MLLCPTQNRFEWNYFNASGVSFTPGTSVVPGASNAEGSWTQVASAANIANDVYLVWVWLTGGATSAQVKQHLLDIGVDPAGGTSYAAVLSDIVCGSSQLCQAGGRHFCFPLFIKGGSSVAVRIQGSNSTAGSVRVAVKFYGNPTRPEMVRAGSFSETIGAITASGGVAFTPGNGVDGAWVSLGTTTKPLWWWQVCVQIDDSTMTGSATAVDLAYGDGTNKTPILEDEYLAAGNGEQHFNAIQLNCYKEVPAGSEIFVRGRCSTTPDAGNNVVAVGIG